MAVYNPSGTQNVSSVSLSHTTLRASLNVSDIYQSTDKIYSTSINVSSGTNVIVPPISGRSILVNGYTLVASGSSVTYFASSGTRLTGDMIFGANGGVRTDSQSFYTSINDPLVLNCTSYVGGHLSYRII